MNKWSVYDEIEYKRLKKLYWITLLLGWCGVHRFYQKKIGTGILYLCTFGLFAIGWLVDGVKVALEWQKLIDKKNIGGRTREEVLERAKSLNQKALYNNISKAYKKLCPACGSTNCHAFVEEVVLREGKVKGKITPNLNPLKPFTIANYKEKEVRKPITTQVSKFVCNDCGEIFN